MKIEGLALQERHRVTAPHVAQMCRDLVSARRQGDADQRPCIIDCEHPGPVQVVDVYAKRRLPRVPRSIGK